MAKSRKRSRRQAQADRSATTDIVTQLECAIRRPQATLIGALVGGIVPWFARTLAHDQLPTAKGALAMIMVAVVLGCALFSAITVFKFGKATFNDTRKAIGFVAAIEGVMLVSTGSTSDVALAVLVLINALANGSSIALAREATCKRRDAAARASVTRARSRDKAAAAPQVVDKTAARVSRKPAGLVVQAPQWSMVDDTVIDAEIISEERAWS